MQRHALRKLYSSTGTRRREKRMTPTGMHLSTSQLDLPTESIPGGFMVDGIVDGYSVLLGVHHFSNLEKAQVSPSPEHLRRVWVTRGDLSMQSKDILHCEFSCNDRMLTVTNERTMIAKLNRCCHPSWKQVGLYPMSTSLRLRTLSPLFRDRKQQVCGPAAPSNHLLPFN